MHIPKHFTEQDVGIIHQFLIETGFGMLVSSNSNMNLPVITHLPFLIRNSNPYIIEGHMARANPHAQFLNGHSTLVVQGPHAYISPSFYEINDVPTWNYVSVHLQGHIVQLSDNELLELIELQMNLAEADFAQALHFDGLKKSYTNALVKQIVGFRMVVDNIESAFKLSQNRSVSDQNSIVNNLFMGKASDRVLAEFMKNYLKI